MPLNMTNSSPPAPEVIILVAMAQNRVIGHQGQIPWHIPADIKLFKEVTMGHAIIMGRKTYDSIGHPLPGRTNIVISRQPDLTIPGCLTAPSVTAGLELAAQNHDKIFNIGGSQIFSAGLPQTDTIYLTQLQREVPGDTFFPEIPPEFTEISARKLPAQEPLIFKVYKRRQRNKDS